MTPDELDLEKGDETRAERIAARQSSGGSDKGGSSRRAKASNASSGGTTRTKASAADRIEGQLKEKLVSTFTRIADSLAARGDEELSTIISEDTEVMTQGIVSLTRVFTWLRSPLLLVLNLIEPILAFGRVGRVLFERWNYRRASQPSPTEGDNVTQMPTHYYESPLDPVA